MTTNKDANVDMEMAKAWQAEPVALPVEEPEEVIPADENFDLQVEQLLDDLRLLLVSKRRDYGPGNLVVFGEPGVLVRLWDKVERLRNLLFVSKAEPDHESIEDNWMDVAGYATLAILIHRLGVEQYGKLRVAPKRQGSKKR